MRPKLEAARSAIRAAVAYLLASSACGGAAGSGAASPYVYERGAPTGDAVSNLMLRREVCEREDLRPELARLDEMDLVRFLEQHDVKVGVERPRPDLAYVTVLGAAGTGTRLRVAILGDADEAGRELNEALAQHGAGSWGVHRANLAVLGPVEDAARVLRLVAKTKLACWGVLTMASGGDVYVIAGGYREL